MKEDVGLLIKMIHETIDKVANRHLAPLGLTMAQMRFLEYLGSKEKKKATQKEFEDHFGISHPTTVGILKRLEKKNLVTTRTDPKDRRNKIVEPGTNETLFHAEMEQFRIEMEERLLKGLDEKRKRDLIELLHILYRNVTE